MKERVWRRGPAPETPIHNCPIEGYCVCVCVYNAKVMQFLFILLIILLIITLKPPMLGS